MSDNRLFPYNKLFFFVACSIVVLLITLLSIATINHCLIFNALIFSDNASNSVETLEELKNIRHSILNESSISFLTTIIVVLLISIGIYFLQNADKRLKLTEIASGKLHREDERLREKDVDLEKKNVAILDKTFNLERANQTVMLHIPITFIYSATSIMVERNFNLEYEQGLLMSFFYKIERQINCLNTELTKKIILDSDIKQMLTMNYLKDSIDNLKIIVKKNNIDWSNANKIILDLEIIQNKIIKSNTDKI